MKKVIITGPTGAIGMALIQKCIEENIKVLAIVNPNSTREDNLPKHELVTTCKLGLQELSKLSQIISEHDYDVFYHLGWCATTGSGRNDVPLQLSNIEYTITATEVAKAMGCKRFVGAGSQAEYGRPYLHKDVISDDAEYKLSPDTPTFPENGYGIAKLAAGNFSRIRCEQLGIEHIWTRILSVYGPYDGPNSLISYVINSLLSGESPELTAGEQIWDYIYAKDAALALFLVGISGKDGKTYCIGSGRTRLLREYVDEIKRQISSDVEVGFGRREYSEGQVMFLQADIRALEEDVDFKPVYSFEEGIKETIAWYKNRIATNYIDE